MGIEPHFNSIKVQLELDYFNGVLPTAQLFQFHKGTIRTALLRWNLLPILNFNSIKVQLERGAAPQYVAKYVKFQFHKGTIRTVVSQQAVQARGLFQFHKGTIRTFVSSLDGCCHSYFNSIKVQLERRFVTTITLIDKFQFHKGTIRTSLLGSYALIISYFNSIKVQLELSNRYRNKLRHRHFNSIKVQLEPDTPIGQTGDI